jgi:hypothetical protein
VVEQVPAVAAWVPVARAPAMAGRVLVVVARPLPVVEPVPDAALKLEPAQTAPVARAALQAPEATLAAQTPTQSAFDRGAPAPEAASPP